MFRRNGATRGLLMFAIGYIVMVIVVADLMVVARSAALSSLATPQSIAEWETWREEARERGDRREPKSPEPPGLVLMRDYFGVCTTGALLFTSILYWLLVWFVTGMLRTRPTAPT
jgi:hypothetical protein